MKYLLSAILLTFAFSSASGQNLIGYKYDEIRNFMSENYKDLDFNNVNNTRFNYLKYSDKEESQTVLFFLGRDSVCMSIRIVCDESARTKKVNEFNSLYIKKGANRWIDSRNGSNYLIELKDEEWASVITMLPSK